METLISFKRIGNLYELTYRLPNGLLISKFHKRGA